MTGNMLLSQERKFWIMTTTMKRSRQECTASCAMLPFILSDWKIPLQFTSSLRDRSNVLVGRTMAQQKAQRKTVTLPAGERVPAFGMGTWQMGDEAAAHREEIAT